MEVQSHLWRQDWEPWRKCSFVLPGQAGKVILQIQKAHPFLAEYNEKLIIEHSSHPPVTFLLNTDSGGEDFLNFYLYKTSKNYLRLKGKWNEMFIELSSLKQQAFEMKPHNQKWIYLGRCDKREHFLRFLSPSQAKEELVSEPAGG